VKCLLGVTVEETKILEERILSHDRSTVPGAVRMSFGMYNTKAEVDKMAEMLKRIVERKYLGKYTLRPETGEYVPDGFKINYADYYQI
jgi:cysteine sulfinate desulfinase/cysteine desulfurase-like protein